MAHINKVVRSINMRGEQQCVDVFVRPDGSFGFDEYRRDPEDPGRGWYSIGGYGGLEFSNADLALGAALTAVYWLKAAIS